MEHKAWRWSRKMSEKTIIANGRNLQGDKSREIGSSRCPSNLSQRFAYCECTAKEEQMRNSERIAEQALAGQKVAEAEAAMLKQELDKALQQGEAAEQRLAHLETALKDCMYEVESLRRDQEERLQNTTVSKAQKKLECKLVESNKRVANLSAENTNLMRALICKEKLIEDLDKGKAQLEAEFDMLMDRLDTAEQAIELLNEERDYSRRSARAQSKIEDLTGLEHFRKGCIKNQSECQALVATGIEIVQKHDSWLDEVLDLILEEHRISKRSYSEILRDIEIVLGCKGRMISEENCSNISGLLPWGSPNSYDKDASFTKEKIRKCFDSSNGDNHNTLDQMIRIQSSLQEESRVMKEKLQLATEENVCLKEKVEESDQTIGRLRREVDVLREMEDQIENQRLMNEDLNTQLTVAKSKLNAILHKLSSLEVELEDKNNCCEELETTCLELQLQLETISRKESPNLDIDQLAKILKALPSPDTKILDMAPQRSSLRDRMLAEDEHPRDSLLSSNAKQNSTDKDLQTQQPSLSHNDVKAVSEQVGPLAIIPSKKPSSGFGFVKKLLRRRKRDCSKMKTVPLQRNAAASPMIKQRDVLFVA